jgi:hypothetical protein
MLASALRERDREGEAAKEAAIERGIRWAYMNDIGTARNVTDAVARWRAEKGQR